MKATGSKLIKIAEAYGRDILQDVDTKAIVVDIDGQFVVVSNIEDAFNIAGRNMAVVGF